jgi:HAD superfamily hydrolase (TIGR01509 family)
MRWNTLIFDRDGTLFNSLPVILRAFNHGIEPFTEKRPTDAEWFQAFGPSEPEVMATFVGEKYKQLAYNRFYAYYRDHFNEIELFPGLRPLLERLHEGGAQMSIFTGGGYESTVFCLQQQKILSFFRVLVTGDRVKRPKPHPEGVLQALQGMNAAPASAAVVGDAGADVQAGKQAGTATVLVRWAAYAPPFDLPSQPDHTCLTVAEFEQLLFEE